MIRALIADDEELSRRALQQLLTRHDDVEIVAECRDGIEARDALETLEPDVAFLDIRMPLESGLDVALTRDRHGRTLIVFVTAFDKFALPAFDADAADYLTKPLTEARFDETLARVRNRLRDFQAADRLAALPSSTRQYVAHLVARTTTADIVIALESIDYIQADDVYAAVVTRGKRHLIRQPLDALEESLDPRDFVRVHRSYIVRLDRVASVRRGDGTNAEVVLSNGTTLPVSRRRRAALADWLRSRTVR
jgi:two-component system LytT family response regulator